MSVVWVGVDVGANGGLAAVDGTGWTSIIDMPMIKSGLDTYALLTWVGTLSKVQFWAVERQHAFPGNSSQTVFQLGRGYGGLLAIAAMLPHVFVSRQFSLELVASQKWKAAFGLLKANDRKLASCEVAVQLFPHAELKGPRGAWRDGRAEALLIAEWLRRSQANLKTSN